MNIPTFHQRHRGRFRIEVSLVPATAPPGEKPLGEFCLNCEHTGHVYGDPRRAWCTVYGVLRGNTHRVICPHYATKDAK